MALRVEQMFEFLLVRSLKFFGTIIMFFIFKSNIQFAL